jgi:hypothetical protein
VTISCRPSVLAALAIVAVTETMPLRSSHACESRRYGPSTPWECRKLGCSCAPASRNRWGEAEIHNCRRLRRDGAALACRTPPLDRGLGTSRGPSAGAARRRAVRIFTSSLDGGTQWHCGRSHISALSGRKTRQTRLIKWPPLTRRVPRKCQPRAEVSLRRSIARNAAPVTTEPTARRVFGATRTAILRAKGRLTHQVGRWSAAPSATTRVKVPERNVLHDEEHADECRSRSSTYPQLRS